MLNPVDFEIGAFSILCKEVRAKGLTTFHQLAEYIQALPYGRISNFDNSLAVLQEMRGTCSSKHQLLAAVAHECGHSEIQLVVGIYEMSEENTPGVGVVLSKESLLCIPEAHCYLISGNERFDYTGLSSGSCSVFDALLSEHIVAPADLMQTKKILHMNAMANWASTIGISVSNGWVIREACIAVLVANSVSEQI